MVAPRTPQRIGHYAKTGLWRNYWRTAVSHAAQDVLTIRGYPIDQIVARCSYSDTLFLTLRGFPPDKRQRRVFDAALSALPDHGLLSSQALAARTVASAWPSSPIPAIAAGLLCIGEITISPQESGEIIAAGLTRIGEGISPGQAASEAVERQLSAGRLLPGFGHPQHKGVDLRAAALRSVVKAEGMWKEGGAFYDEVHRALVARKRIELPMNIDGALGCVLHDLGFTPLQMAGLAAVAILPGIIAQCVEEITTGVPLRIIPEGGYDGPAKQELDGGLYR